MKKVVFNLVGCALISAALCISCKDKEDPVVSVVPVESISVSPNPLDLTEGNSETVTVTVLPSEANQAVTWSTNNSSVVSVSQNGTIKAEGVGRATITVESAENPNKFAELSVTVFKPVPATYSVIFVTEGALTADIDNVWEDWGMFQVITRDVDRQLYAEIGTGGTIHHDPATWRCSWEGDGVLINNYSKLTLSFEYQTDCIVDLAVSINLITGETVGGENTFLGDLSLNNEEYYGTVDVNDETRWRTFSVDLTSLDFPAATTGYHRIRLNFTYPYVVSYFRNAKIEVE